MAVSEFDCIIVGAGSAGCALAGQLAAACPSARIALVERGVDVIHDSNISNPIKWPANLFGPSDYAYNTAVQSSLGQRWLHCPRGCGLGGSSLINAMIYSRGFQEDWDRMPHGWRSANVTPLFDMIEEKLKPSLITPGVFGGAVKVAAEELGFPSREVDSWDLAGVMNGLKVCIDRTTSRRIDVYRAFGANSSNVTIVQGMASRVLFEDRNGMQVAVGLQLQGRSSIHIHTHGEVILCAGAVDTPKLLQLSGIGPAELLARFRIPLVQDLPVGHGLKDHTLLPIAASTNTAINPASHLCSNGIECFINDEEHGIQLMILNGITLPSMIIHILRTCMNKPGFCCSIGRILLGYVVVPMVKALVKLGPVRTALHSSVGINVCLTRPSSTGTVLICSSDPADPPVINPNYLSTDEDRSMLRAQ